MPSTTFAPAEQQLTLVPEQIWATGHKPLHHRLPAAQLVLQQEVVERGYQFQLVADELIRKVVPQYPAAVAVKARLPGELQQLPLQLRTTVHQARDRYHTPLPSKHRFGGRFDAIGEPSTATCGTPMRPVPGFDPDVNLTEPAVPCPTDDPSNESRHDGILADH